MEPILPIESPISFDTYRDYLTHHYSAPVFYDALRRELSFAKREGNLVGVVKMLLPEATTLDHLLFFSNELEILVRQHDLISRVAEREFLILLRFDSDITDACMTLIQRMKTVEKREFYFAWTTSDGSRGVAEVLEILDNPQIYCSSKSL